MPDNPSGPEQPAATPAEPTVFTGAPDNPPAADPAPAAKPTADETLAGMRTEFDAFKKENENLRRAYNQRDNEIRQGRAAAQELARLRAGTPQQPQAPAAGTYYLENGGLEPAQPQTPQVTPQDLATAHASLQTSDMREDLATVKFKQDHPGHDWAAIEAIIRDPATQAQVATFNALSQEPDVYRSLVNAHNLDRLRKLEKADGEAAAKRKARLGEQEEEKRLGTISGSPGGGGPATEGFVSVDELKRIAREEGSDALLKRFGGKGLPINQANPPSLGTAKRR